MLPATILIEAAVEARAADAEQLGGLIVLCLRQCGPGAFGLLLQHPQRLTLDVERYVVTLV